MTCWDALSGMQSNFLGGALGFFSLLLLLWIFLVLRNFTKPFFRIFKAKVGAHCDVKTLPEYVEGGELVFLK